MKKIVSLMMVLTMSISLVACGNQDKASDDASKESMQTQGTGQTAEDASYTIGICQLMQHDALDAATQGFKDAVTEGLGEAVTFDGQNAQGDSNI